MALRITIEEQPETLVVKLEGRIVGPWAAEREHILRALREAKGMIGGPTGAAAKLGLKRTTLNSKIKKLRIERGDYM